METKAEGKKNRLRNLPKIDELLILLGKSGLDSGIPRDIVKSLCRGAVSNLRAALLEGNSSEEGRTELLSEARKQVEREMAALRNFRLRAVVNATGVIIHTNLGRAPLCNTALARLLEIGANYSNLEFNLEMGHRGLRYDHVQKLLCLLTGAEDALIVNNNAAAVLLTLNTLAEGRQAIVSRGELVEIGGEFRIPEVMEKSGAFLREVGTTNRTRREDYEKALSGETGILLKVHTSNFRIIGFTEEAPLEELVALARDRGIPLVDDLGSGCLIDLAPYGLEREPTVPEVLSKGVDVVTCSGDKLLGGPQAGIILGRADLLQRIKENPLNRALRIDKLTLAALEATLMEYLQPDGAVQNIRVLKCLTESAADVMRRARKLLRILKASLPTTWFLSLKTGSSLAGGGALPTREIETALISLRLPHTSAARLEEQLRKLEVPILTRINEEEILLDVRTIEEGDFPLIKRGLISIASAG